MSGRSAAGRSERLLRRGVLAPPFGRARAAQAPVLPQARSWPAACEANRRERRARPASRIRPLRDAESQSAGSAAASGDRERWFLVPRLAGSSPFARTPLPPEKAARRARRGIDRARTARPLPLRALRARVGSRKVPPACAAQPCPRRARDAAATRARARNHLRPRRLSARPRARPAGATRGP